MKNNLSKDKRKQLQKKASILKPIIMIGQKGLTDAVLAEIDSALNIHELIKVRIRGADKDECAEQCLKLLAEPLLSEEIRIAGMKRVRANGVGHENICRAVLEKVDSLLPVCQRL